MGWLEDRYKGTQTIGSDGRVDGRGIGAFFWQQFVDEDKINRESQIETNTDLALEQGRTLSELDVDPGGSTKEIQGAIITRGKEERKEEKELDFERSMAPGRESNQLLREQLADTRRSNDLDRADRKEARADDLALQRMQMVREDQRYNERLDREEASRRRESIMALTQGLAALGAAFAM